MKRESFLNRGKKVAVGAEYSAMQHEELETGGYVCPDCRLARHINRIHKISFTEDVIPDYIRTKHGEPVRILDMGCGQGIFTDQLRTEFGDAVNVYGTTPMRRIHQERRVALFQGDHVQGSQALDAADIRYVRSNLSPKMHPNDGKWNSVREMQDYEEFDLIIDTIGETFYAFDAADADHNRLEDALQTLGSACRKLKKGGRLYIGNMNTLGSKWLHEHSTELENTYGVRVILQSSDNDPRTVIEKSVV